MQCPPGRQCGLCCIRPAQGMAPVGLLNGGDAAQVSKQCIRIGTCDLGVARVGKDRIQQPAVAGAAMVQCTPEVASAPVPNSCICLRSGCWRTRCRTGCQRHAHPRKVSFRARCGISCSCQRVPGRRRARSSQSPFPRMPGPAWPVSCRGCPVPRQQRQTRQSPW